MSSTPSTGTPRRRTVRPWWLSAWVAVWVLWAASLTVLIEPVVAGRAEWNGGALGGFVVVVGGAFRRDEDVRALSADDRRRVLDAVRTGTPTWELRLDRLVQGRLRRGALTRSRSDLGAALVVVGVIQVFPVLAALRVHQAWYLLALGPSLLLLAAVVLPARRDRGRLARFEAALDASDS